MKADVRKSQSMVRGSKIIKNVILFIPCVSDGVAAIVRILKSYSFKPDVREAISEKKRCREKEVSY